MGKFSLQNNSILIGIIAAISLVGARGAHAIDLDGPCWKPEIQDTQMALFEPDRYAWELFKELNHPARLWSKCPDPKKKLGDEGPVLWETWRNIAPENEQTIFPAKGENPGPWRTEPDKELVVASLFESSPRSRVRTWSDLVVTVRESRAPLAEADRSASAWRGMHQSLVRKKAIEDRSGSEIRLNRDSYLHIRDNQLYNRDVLAARAAMGDAGSLNLPPETKEIKVRWMEITEQDKPRYHWVEFEDEKGNRQIWGLTALHISTKDLPNWFWATWEHVDTKPLWETITVDAHACPGNPVGCDDVPEEIKGTKWENYIMRGTQINFVDKRGHDTLLTNAQIEDGIQDISSCITCHAEAAMKPDGTYRVHSNAYLGVPKAKAFEGLMLMDFMFVFDRASSPSDK